MPITAPRIAVFLHLYDFTLADELVSYINQIPVHYHVDVLVNIPLTDEEFQRYRQIDQKLRQLNPAFARHFFVTENRGRDIGGFFYLIYKVLLWEQQPDYVLFLHSKRSAYMGRKGREWRRSLAGYLLDADFFERRLAEFENDPTLGMTGHPDSLQAQDVDQYLAFQAGKYGLTYSPDTPYIAGTMFMARWAPFRQTFEGKPNPRYRWQQGEYDHPSECHSWERLFGQLIIDKGYTVNGFQRITEGVAEG